MMIMRTKEYGDVDLDTATRETLVLIRAGLYSDLQEINFAISDAKETYRATGERYAHDWIRRTHIARKSVLKRLGHVNAVLSSIPKERKPPSKKGQDVANLFVDFARARLPEDVFQGILDDAIELWKIENA